MATHVVSKGSIYRIGVVLKTTTKLYVCRMWCGISYFQNLYSITNPIPLHDIYNSYKLIQVCDWLKSDAWVVECTHAICCEEWEVPTYSSLKMSQQASRFLPARPTCLGVISIQPAPSGKPVHTLHSVERFVPPTAAPTVTSCCDTAIYCQTARGKTGELIRRWV